MERMARTLPWEAHEMPNKSAVHIVHTLGFGFGSIGVGLPDWGLFRGRGRFSREEPGSSPTSGTMFPGRFSTLGVAKTAESDAALHV